MKKITTIEEHDNNGKLIKKTVVEEEGASLPAYIPFTQNQTPGPESTLHNTPGIDRGNKIV